MKYCIFLSIGILGYFLMRSLTGIHIFSLIHEVLVTLMQGAIKGGEHYRETTAQAFSRMSLDQKHKSAKYKYYCFINEVLAVFGFKDRGVNVEGFTIALVFVSIVIGLVVSLITSSVFYAFLLPVLLLPLFIAFIFLISRVSVRNRKIQLLDAMDILCAVMSDGILKAIKDNYQQFPEDIRPYFKRFLTDVELLNVSIPQAINNLNNDVGDLYDEFCDSVLTYEANRAKGMETLFTFYISENGKTQARDRRIKRMSDRANMDYFASIGAIAVFGIFSTTQLGTGNNLWATPFGRIVLVALVISAVVIFIYIQYLLSKAYVYTERSGDK